MGENLVVTTGAESKVPNMFDRWGGQAAIVIGRANETLQRMIGIIEGITPAAPGKAQANVDYTKPEGLPYYIPDRAYNIPFWKDIPLNLKEIRKFNPSEFTQKPPAQVSPNIPAKPSAKPIQPPGVAPTLEEIEIPPVPELPIVADPKQWAISIPTAPIIEIPPFSAMKPSASGITSPNSDFNWTEDPYTSGLLDETVAQISKYFAGGVGIPEEVWEALWARENDRENRAGDKLVTEINEEWSSRGFNLPQGVQSAQIQEVRQGLQNTAAGRSRDIAIQEAQLEIENLRFAVQQGIAMENLRGQWYQQSLSRQLEAATFTARYAIEVMNAQVNLFNARVQMYSTEAQVYKIEIDALLVELEVYKSELEGQKLIGQLNQQEIEIYKSKIEATNLILQQYTVALEAIKTEVEVQTLELEAYKTTVETYATRIKAQSIEYDAYNTQMQGAKIESEIYGETVSAYAANVKAYDSLIGAEMKQTESDIAVNNFAIAENAARINEYNAQLASALEGIKSDLSIYNTGLEKYKADIANESALSDAQAKAAQIEVNNAQMETQASIASAEQWAAHIAETAKIWNAAMEVNAKINGAHASALMSAVNVRASISDTANNSASI